MSEKSGGRTDTQKESSFPSWSHCLPLLAPTMWLPIACAVPRGACNHGVGVTPWSVSLQISQALPWSECPRVVRAHQWLPSGFGLLHPHSGYFLHARWLDSLWSSLSKDRSTTPRATTTSPIIESESQTWRGCPTFKFGFPHENRLLSLQCF